MTTATSGPMTLGLGSSLSPYFAARWSLFDEASTDRCSTARGGCCFRWAEFIGISRIIAMKKSSQGRRPDGAT